MGHRETVIDFVRGIFPKAICDDCLSKRLKFSQRQRANQITRPLSKSPSFDKTKRVCNFCGDDKLSISSREADRNSLIPKQHVLQPKEPPLKNKANKASIAVGTKADKLGLTNLIQIGFRKVGLWVLDGQHLQLQLISKPKLKPALYCFVSNKQILYVGKTSQYLHKRLYFYGKPGATQKTNLRLNPLLKQHLADRKVVEIYAFGDQDEQKVGNFILDIPAALEDDIIRKTQPLWNSRRF